jgi:two-component system, OmpR family, response regulator PhoP
MRILVIEDELDLLADIKSRLEDEGHTVDTSSDGDDGYYIASEYPQDAAIIDIGLPGMSGIDIIKKLRQQQSTLPILILTARSRWQEKVEGLEAGADDYLVKPFQMEELLARVKALLRRATGSPGSELTCGCITLKLETQQVKRDDSMIDVTAYEYRMLEYLMRHHTEAVSKTRLSDYLYPHDDDRDSNVIEVLIGRLRKKLDPDGTLQPIETLRNRGYRFTLCDGAIADKAGDRTST